MATRCKIAARFSKDETIKAINCHYDGYLQHTGVKLLTNYYDNDIIEELLLLGNIQSLGYSPEETQSYYNMGRETYRSSEYKTVEELLEDNNYVDYIYFWDVDKWLVRSTSRNNFERLADLI